MLTCFCEHLQARGNRTTCADFRQSCQQAPSNSPPAFGSCVRCIFVEREHFFSKVGPLRGDQNSFKPSDNPLRVAGCSAVPFSPRGGGRCRRTGVARFGRPRLWRRSFLWCLREENFDLSGGAGQPKASPPPPLPKSLSSKPLCFCAAWFGHLFPFLLNNLFRTQKWALLFFI